MCFIQTVSGLSIIQNECERSKALHYLHICAPICIFIVTTASITAEENKGWTCDTQKYREKPGKALITSDVKSASELQRSRRLQRLTAGCKLALKGVGASRHQRGAWRTGEDLTAPLRAVRRVNKTNNWAE